MKLLTASIAFAGLATLTSAAPLTTQDSCGKCDTLPSPRMGGSAQIPLRGAVNKSGEKVYKCTTFGEEVLLSTCTNQTCGLCMMFKDDDCKGEVMHWGHQGTDFDGTGAKSYFCV